MEKGKFFLTGSLLLVLIGLGATDALLVENEPLLLLIGGSQSSSASSSSAASSAVNPFTLVLPPEISSTGSVVSSASSASTQAVAVITTVEGAGVRTQDEMDIQKIIERLGFVPAETQEQSLLAGVARGGEPVYKAVLLKDKDRAGFIAWIQTPRVKEYFLVLKETLHSLFSPEVKDLLDEVQHTEGRPPRNFLTFLDPSISEERVVFIRIRDRLFEFRISQGKDDAVYQLIEALSN